MSSQKYTKILVLSKSAYTHWLISEFLQDSAFKVVGSFRNFEEANHFFARNYREIEIVVLDVIMPEQSGLVTFSQWKKFKAELHFIFITPLPKLHFAQKMPYSKLYQFIQLPISRSPFMAALCELRNRAKMMGALKAASSTGTEG